MEEDSTRDAEAFVAEVQTQTNHIMSGLKPSEPALVALFGVTTLLAKWVADAKGQERLDELTVMAEAHAEGLDKAIRGLFGDPEGAQ